MNLNQGESAQVIYQCKGLQARDGQPAAIGTDAHREEDCAATDMHRSEAYLGVDNHRSVDGVGAVTRRFPLKKLHSFLKICSRCLCCLLKSSGFEVMSTYWYYVLITKF